MYNNDFTIELWDVIMRQQSFVLYMLKMSKTISLILNFIFSNIIMLYWGVLVV